MAFLVSLLVRRGSPALAKRTERFSCADLMNLVKRGCQRPVNRGIEKMKDGQDGGQELLTQQDLDLALEKLHPSVEPEDIARIEKWMVKVGMKLPAAA